MQSVRGRVGRKNPGRFAPLAPKQGKPGRRRAQPPVRGADGKDEVPLSEKRPVGRAEGVAGIVDVRGLSRRTVELDDLKTPTGPQLSLGRITNVVAADEETVELLGEGVDAALQRLGPK